MNVLRKAIHTIREKYWNKILMKAAELRETEVIKDAIGFGSVKHLY